MSPGFSPRWETTNALAPSNRKLVDKSDNNDNTNQERSKFARIEHHQWPHVLAVNAPHGHESKQLSANYSCSDCQNCASLVSRAAHHIVVILNFCMIIAHAHNVNSYCSGGRGQLTMLLEPLNVTWCLSSPLLLTNNFN